MPNFKTSCALLSNTRARGMYNFRDVRLSSLLNRKVFAELLLILKSFGCITLRHSPVSADGYLQRCWKCGGNDFTALMNKHKRVAALEGILCGCKFQDE
jgi:hypothetical protein